MSWTKLVPRSLPYYPTDRAWADAGGLGKPVSGFPRVKRWRDNAAANRLQELEVGSGGGSLFGSFLGFRPAPADEVREYRVLARDERGQLLLTPVDSPAAYATYSMPAIRAYQEFAYMVPNGVPYLTTIRLSLREAAALNFEGTGEVPVPVELGAGTVLVPDGRGDVLVFNEPQEFSRAARPDPATPRAERLRIVLQVLQNDALTVDAKWAAVTQLLTIPGTQFTLT